MLGFASVAFCAVPEMPFLTMKRMEVAAPSPPEAGPTAWGGAGCGDHGEWPLGMCPPCPHGDAPWLPPAQALFWAPEDAARG